MIIKLELKARSDAKKPTREKKRVQPKSKGGRFFMREREPVREGEGEPVGVRDDTAPKN